MKGPSISLIVTTYNWPSALHCVLSALAEQRYPQLEVIVADDGSTDETAKLIHAWRDRLPFPLIHCWQSDEGFRAAMIRNRAVALAKHDYLIFIDGDCVVFPNFVRRHAALAEAGWFVAGNRVLLSQTFTQYVLENALPIHQWPFFKWVDARWRGHCNQVLPLCTFPNRLRKLRPLKWQGAKTCNLGMWRSDFLRVNGFDETFEGWGFEDSDCVLRLQRANVFHKSAKCFAPVLHLWHPAAQRDQAQNNAKRLEQTKQSSIIESTKGVKQYFFHGND